MLQALGSSVPNKPNKSQCLYGALKCILCTLKVHNFADVTKGARLLTEATELYK